MYNIIITDYITNPDIEKDILGDNCQITCLDEENEECFPEIIKDADILLVWHATITLHTIKKLKSCKAIIRYGVGFDNIDVKCAFEHGIPFANNPDYGIHEVADSACALILAFTRGIPYYNNSYNINSNIWQKNILKFLNRSTNHTLGIIGFGRIGTAVGLRMEAFGMKICFYDPFLSSGHEKPFNFHRHDTIDELLEHSSIVTIHCPLNDQSISMIDEEFINKLNNNTILINTSRGKVVKNLDIIYQGLESGKISCIGLDVLPDEPPDKSEKLIQAWQDNTHPLNSKIIIMPHISYYSDESWIEMRQKCACAARNALEGLALKNIILP